jgi:regulator of sigma E protease
MGIIVAAFSLIIILGAAVVIHEFGHFIVAKMLGIRVETFSVGFGKRLWGRRWGTTDYRISLIPLGGYVKLGGDESNSGLEEGAGEDIPTAERFDLRPRWQKFLVGVAGPVMNILTAIVIPLGWAMTAGAPVMPAPVVTRIIGGGAAEAAGLQVGDRIVSFNGRENGEWKKMENDALLSPEQPLPLVVERNGQRINLTIKPSKQVVEGETFGDLDFDPDFGNVPVVLNGVLNDSPAAAAGLLPGDRILSINGEAVHSRAQLIRYIKEHAGQQLRIAAQRGDAPKEFTVSTRRDADGVDRIGITPEDIPPIKKLGFADATSYAIQYNIEMIRLTGIALGQIFSGQRSVRDTVSGPIGIAVASKRAVEQGGVEGGLRLLGFLSLNLGVFNLLPIPVLDGGMIFMLFVEGFLALLGLKLSMTVRERIQQVGFVFLLLLMGFVIINDLTKQFSRYRSSGDPTPAVQQK